MATLPGLNKSDSGLVDAQYVALVAGTGYSAGDVIETVSNPETGETVYYNATTGAFIDAPAVADLQACSYCPPIEHTYSAINDGTGYSVGDVIETHTDPAGNTVYWNASTQQFIDPAPLPADLASKAPLSADVEEVEMLDTDPATGAVTKFIRVRVYDCVGEFQRTYDIDMTGAVYVPAGTVTCASDGPAKVCLGSETVALTDAADAALTVPAGATKATITAFGDVYITFDGVSPAAGAAHAFGDCQNGVIEGCELASLLARSVAATGTLYVSYSNC